MEKIVIQHKWRDWRRPWTEWELLCDAENEEEAKDIVAFLERENRREKKEGLQGAFEDHKYRWIRTHKFNLGD